MQSPTKLPLLAGPLNLKAVSSSEKNKNDSSLKLPSIGNRKTRVQDGIDITNPSHKIIDSKKLLVTDEEGKTKIVPVLLARIQKKMPDLLHMPAQKLSIRHPMDVSEDPPKWLCNWIDKIIVTRAMRLPASMQAKLADEVMGLYLEFASSSECTITDASNQYYTAVVIRSGVHQRARMEFISISTELRKDLAETLFISHQFHLKLRNIWYQNFQKLSMFRSFDSEDVITVLENNIYFRLQEAQCQYVRDVLHLDWLQSIQDLFSSQPESWWVGNALHNRFLASVKCLMGLQLCQLLSQYANDVVAFVRYHRAPLFSIRLCVDDGGQVYYDPNPSQILAQMCGLLRLARSVVCSVPVLHSDMSTDPEYFGAKLVSEAQANAFLEEAERQLEAVFAEHIPRLNDLIDMYRKFEYIFSEPYFDFTNEFTDNNTWKSSEKIWRALFQKTKSLRHKILSLSPSLVTVGIFRIQITPRIEEAGRELFEKKDHGKLAAPALESKATSLLGHVVSSVLDRLLQDTSVLRADLDPIFHLCNEISDNPKRLIEISNLIHEARAIVKKTMQLGKALFQKLEFLWSIEVTIPDDHGALILTTIFMAASLKCKLRDATTRFAEHRWIVEEDLLSRRREIDSFLDQFRRSEITHIFSFISTNQVGEYLSFLDKAVAKLDATCQIGSDIMAAEEQVGLPVVSFHLLEDTLATVKLHRLLWEYAANITEILRLWQKMIAVDVNVDRLNKTSSAWLQDFAKMLREFPPEKACHQIASLLQRQVARFSRLVPALRVWTSKSLLHRHWDQIFSVLKQESRDVHEITIGDLQVWGVHKVCEELVRIEKAAAAEYKVAEEIDVMMQSWEAHSLPVRTLKIGGTYYVESFRDVDAMLRDHLMRVEQLESQQSTSYNDKQIALWGRSVTKFQEAIRLWAKVQSRYLKTLPFFYQRSFEFSKSDADLFKTIDQRWCELMSVVAEGPSWKSVSDDETLHARLSYIDHDINAIAPSLQVCLDLARTSCARFYLVTDDELADILSCEIENAGTLGKVVNRLFPNVFGVDTQAGTGSICLARSEYGESLDLIPFIPTLNVRRELWFSALSQRLYEAVRKEINRARKSFVESLSCIEWIERNSEQAAMVAHSIHFINDVERMLAHHSCIKEIKELLLLKETELSQFSSFVSRDNVNSNGRKKLSSFVVHTANQRGILTTLINASHFNGVGDFEWQRNIRLYWRDQSLDCEEGVDICIMHRTYSYGMEYLGNQKRLVLSETLQNEFNIIGMAIGLRVGGALLGPSGNGKSSSVQEIAAVLGIYCFYFRCNSDSSVQVLNRICKGIIASGCWICMQHCQALSLDAMAVFQSSILSIQRALRSKRQNCDLHGEDIQFPEAYSEKNPICSSYLIFDTSTRQNSLPGLTENLNMLPGSIGNLFRPIFSAVPDLECILQVSLMSYGCEAKQSKRLARKLVVLYQEIHTKIYRIHRELFSLNSLLRSVCGSAAIFKIQQGRNFDERNFIHLLIASKIPSLDKDDLRIFADTLQDVFHRRDDVILEVEYLRHQIEDGSEPEPKLDPSEFISIHPNLQQKVSQLQDALHFYDGVNIIGDVFAGKSTAIKEAARKFSVEHTVNKGRPQHINLIYIYPKAFSTSRLFGTAHERDIMERNGLFPKLIESTREMSSSESAVSETWFVFDGDVDKTWNFSLMDLFGSHKSMQLSSGEILELPAKVKILFESLDLTSASPAMVNSCGVISIPQHEKTWYLYILSKLKSMDKRITSAWIQSGDTNFVSALHVLENITIHVLSPCLNFVDKECKKSEYVLCRMHSVMNLWALFENICKQNLNLMTAKSGFDGHWSDASSLQRDHIVAGDLYATVDWVHVQFLFALLWAVGAVLDTAGRKKFEGFLRDICSGAVFVLTAEKRTGRKLHHEFKLFNILPKTGSLFDYVYQDLSQTQSGWILWSDLPFLASRDIILNDSLTDLIVPTFDCNRYVHLLTCMLFSKRPVLLTGPPAVGKTFYVSCAIKQGADRNVMKLSAHMCASTTSDLLQNLIEARLEMKRIGVLGPANDSYLVAHVEDLHLPLSECHSPLELLRQFFDRGGWYSNSEAVFRHVESMHVIATLQTYEFSRATLPRRLVGHFQSLNVVSLSEQDVRSIFQVCLTWYHSKFGFPEFIRDLESSIVAASIDVLNNTRNYLKPTPLCPQYVFSFHDLRNVIVGMMQQTVENLEESVDRSPSSEHLRLWVHEILRVFYDRITAQRDQIWFLNMIKEVIKDKLNQDFDVLFKHLDVNKSGDVDSEELRGLFFGNYMQVREGRQQRSYDEAEDIEAMLNTIQAYAAEYDRVHQVPMQLIVTKFFAEHFSRVSRVLQINGGNMLLIGKDGVGKRSLVKLAAYMSNFMLFEYDNFSSPEDWKELLKSAFRELFTTESKNIILLLSSTFIADEQFDDLNCILNGVEIPGLFSKSEFYEFVKRLELADFCSFSELFESKKQSFRVILCLDMNGKLRDLFLRYPFLINRFTIDWILEWNQETMIEFAAKYFSQNLIPNSICDNEQNTPTLADLCASLFLIAREISTDYNSTIAKFQFSFNSYASFLRLFKSLSTKLMTSRVSEIELLQHNIAIIQCNTEIIGREQADLDLEKATIDSLDKAGVTANAGVEAIRSMIEDLESLTQKTAVDLEQYILALTQTEVTFEELQQSLAPDWAQCMKKINEVSIREISKLKSLLGLANFSSACLQTLALAIFALLEGKTSEEFAKENLSVIESDNMMNPFAPALQMVADNDFKKKLLNLSYTSQSFQCGLEIVKSIYIPQKDFNASEISRACSGAEKLFNWVESVVSFQEKADSILGPTKIELKALNKKIVVSKEESSKHEQVAQDLKRQLLDSIQNSELVVLARTQALIKCEEVKIKSKRASKINQILCNATIDLPKEWTDRLSFLQKHEGCFSVECLLACASITFFGCLSLCLQEYCLTLWMKHLNDSSISIEPEFDVIEFLADIHPPSFIADSKVCGIPLDERQAILNTFILSLSERNHITVDRFGAAQRWILRKEAENSLIEVSMKDLSYVQIDKVKMAMVEGKSVLVKEFLTIKQLARKMSFRVIFKGNRRFQYVGGELVCLHPNFRIYMVTESPVPLNSMHLEFLSDVSLIDFNFDSNGIHACFLKKIMKVRAPEVDQVEDHLLEEYAKAERLLERESPLPALGLVSSNDDLTIVQLEDRINAWLDARSSVLDIRRKLNFLDDRFKVMGVLISPLVVSFQCLVSMSCLHESYDTGYNIFAFYAMLHIERGEQRFVQPLRDSIITRFFKSCLLDQEESVFSDTQYMKKEFQALSKHVFESINLETLRTLFGHHHEAYLFLAAVKSLLASKELCADEWQHFLTNGIILMPTGKEISGTRKTIVETDETVVYGGFGRHGKQNMRTTSPRNKPPYEWLSDQAWSAAERLSQVVSLSRNIREGSLRSSIHSHPGIWKAFLETSNPLGKLQEKETGTIFANLSLFQRLLILRVFHPTHLMVGVNCFLKEFYGSNLTNPLPVSVESLFESSDRAIPLLLLLEHQEDPSEDIEVFAKHRGYRQRCLSYHCSDLNSKKSDEIQHMINDAMKSGLWVLLQNFPDMSRMIEIVLSVSTMEREHCHKQFRLWITAKISNFPKEVLYCCMRAIWTAPSSIRLNLIRNFLSYPISDPEFFFAQENPAYFKRCLFSLCFLHATLMERRARDPLCWNSSVMVDLFDLRNGLVILREIIKKNPNLSNQALQSLIKDVVYGRRLGNIFDQMVLSSMVSLLFAEKILSLGCSFDLEGAYFIPEFLQLENFLSYSISLPTVAPAELIGLPEEFCLRQPSSDEQNFLDILMEAENLSPKSAASSKLVQDPEALPWLWYTAMSSKIDEILSHLPGYLDMNRLEADFAIHRVESCNLILHQESQSYNRLLDLISNSLCSLKEALSGYALLSSDLEQMAQDLYNCRFPDLWQRSLFPTRMSLSAKIITIRDAVLYFAKWIRAGRPIEMWLPAFMYPQTLRSAAISNFLHHMNVDFDKIALSFKVIAKIPSVLHLPPSSGMYLTGIQLCRCRWDVMNEKLTVANENNRHFKHSPLPVLQMIPNLVGDSSEQFQAGREVSEHIFQCPLYRLEYLVQDSIVLEGTIPNLIMVVELPCDAGSGIQCQMQLRGTRLVVEPCQ